MTDQFIRLTELYTRGTCTKEDLFNWIVDLDQEAFDTLCNQIISLYAFQQTYEGTLVSDEENILTPWLPVLPKIMFTISREGYLYQKKYFFQFLSWVEEDQLNDMCEEVLSLYMHAQENSNTYMISPVYPAVAGIVESWRIQFKPATKFADLPQRIKQWQQPLFSE